MSICLETSTVLANPVSTTTRAESSLPSAVTTTNSHVEETIAPSIKNVAKLIVANHASGGGGTPVKVNPPLITVLNPSGPITVVKSICVNSTASSTPQFTVVNSAPLTVTNSSIGKAITLLSAAPVAMVKSVVNSNQNIERTEVVATNNINANNNTLPAVVEKPPVHNVYVKNTTTDLGTQEISQAQKLLTCSTFPHVVSNVITASSTAKTANGQRPVTNNKVKIFGGTYVMPGAGSGPSSNIILNKTTTQTKCLPRQKFISNGATPKYLNKPCNNVVKGTIPQMRNMVDKSRVMYPTHKSQIKTLPPVNNFPPKSAGIKTLSPQTKTVPGQVQRTGSGLRTIPPQRPQKMPNKPNYIGKHAVQANKIKNISQTVGKVKNLKAPTYNYQNRMPVTQSNQVTFNQALTAEILETLGHNGGGGGGGTSNSYSSGKSAYEVSPPPHFDNAYGYPDKTSSDPPVRVEEKSQQSSLDTLSLICQAVLLDHNYNATLPSDSPTRPQPNMSSQMNGISNSLYSPGSGGRSTIVSSNTLSSLSSSSLMPSNSSSAIQDDDAASDISCGSERKHDTEGEETDTAPEAEAVKNDDQFDHYGDYVTRCICDFIHDDGYMIECDNCKVWQHVRCVIRTKQVPDEYLCEVCDPTKPFDRQKARFLQQQWLRDGQFAEAKLRKEGKLKEQFKVKEILSDSDSSEVENTGNNNNLLSKGRANVISGRKHESVQRQSGARQKRETSKDVVIRRPLKRKERKVPKRKTKAQPKVHSDEEQDTWASSQLPQLRQWIENYEEAVTNHYSPELRARISSIRINGAHSDLTTQMDPTVHKCRIHTQPLTGIKYLVSSVNLSPNTPVVELRGKYMLSTQHRNSSGSLTTRQHAQRPGPFLFFYRLHKDNTEVCVDTRTYGNSARFIRRSCKPNAELRHCIEKGVLHLYIVTIASVEKNLELTIKHESHDLAVIGTTHIACACGKTDECTVNRGNVKKNGDTSENHRKRRGRRTVSQSEPEVAPKPNQNPPQVLPPVQVKQEPEPEVKVEIEEKVKVEEKKEIITPLSPVPCPVKVEIKKEEVEDDEEVESLPLPLLKPISTRRSSAHYKSEPEDKKEVSPKEDKKNKKLSREERKIEAIMKAFERMERQQQRKQEHQAKQAHRRESEPGPNSKDDNETKVKRRRRKGRARTVSTNSQHSRRNRLNSAESSYATSGDENLLSPNDNMQQNRLQTQDSNGDQNNANKAVGLLLAIANGENGHHNEKSPARDIDSNSNSAHSSPETPLSSACLLVAAAVEPLEPGFKFPKTKKGLMNEWLNKSPDLVQPASSISPSSLTPHMSAAAEYDSNTGFFTPAKNLAALAQAATFCDTSSRGNAKKRWLRQAISEDQCDSPSSRPESPPTEMVAPPKKRRLPRESLSTDTSPPTTPTGVAPPVQLQKMEESKSTQEGCVEIVHHCVVDSDSPTQTLESDAVLKERAAEMQQEFGSCVRLSETKEVVTTELPPMNCLMDPRLSHHDRPLFSNSEHLVGTVEKTLSILGFEDQKMELPAKRKLSITEYRQRKKLNNNDKIQEETIIEENSSQEATKIRPRSNSSSSTTSFVSSDDDAPPAPEISEKVLSAFNSEPTELERQRENVSLRLKKAFGLSIDEDPRKTVLDVEKLLNCNLTPPIKATVPLSSPTFPIPGSCEQSLVSVISTDHHVSEQSERTSDPKPLEGEENSCEQKKSLLYYTPDEDDSVAAERESAKKDFKRVETTDYVPPFNNPLYPNSNFASYGSVIDDDVPYEGRNPSPPPDLKSEGQGSFSLP